MSRFLTLNIGSSKAVLAEYVHAGKDVLTLTAYGEADLSLAGDSASALSASLTPALQQIMREKGIRPGPLVVSLSGQAVFPRFAKLPNTGLEKLADQVYYEVEQNVPFPADEIVSDYQYLGEMPDGDLAVMIVAAKIDQVRAVTDAVRAAGLTPQIVDVAPMAVYNAFRWSQPEADGCSVVLDIGAKTTSLILAEDEKIYNRTIPVAGRTITRELAQTFNCDSATAEEFKCTRAYVSLGGVTEDADETADRAAKAIRTVLTRLHAEISRSINFYRSQQGGNSPARLFLTGGSVRLPQLDEFFRETLQLEVAFLNPFRRIRLGGKINREAFANDAFTLTESAGLALRFTDAAAIKINLMPPELVAQARALRRIPFIAAGAVAVLAALGAGVFLETSRAARVEAEVACVSARNDRLRKLDGQLKAAQNELRAEQERCEACQQLMRQRGAAVRRVGVVRRSLLPGMWITDWEPLKDVDGVRVTMRGWRDRLAAAEAEYAKGGNRRHITAAEMVQDALKGHRAVAADTVKIVAQRDVKDCLTEFAIELTFAPPPSVLEAAADTKKKGTR